VVPNRSGQTDARIPGCGTCYLGTRSYLPALPSSPDSAIAADGSCRPGVYSSAGGPVEYPDDLANCFTEDELTLLAAPLNLGIPLDPLSSSGQATPTMIDMAPNIIVAGTPLQQVHMHFSVLGFERAYVTFAGKLLGVIRRSQLDGN